jgi:glutamate carboxypeptidase
MDGWVAEHAAAIAATAERDLAALVGVSSPSGDRAGAEQVAALAIELAPPQASAERIPCSTPDHADDVVLRVRGGGSRRLLLLGHLDTVVAHAEHRPLTRDGDRLRGSGAIDMKGGVVLALGVLRALAARADGLAEAALLLVCDEEWRTGAFAHVERFEGYDACLCFEGGQLDPGGGDDAVVVRRKAAATVEVVAEGRSAHSGSAPERGANALLALAVAAQAIAGCHDPDGPDRRTAVPTVVRCGEAFNVVPAAGTLIADVRADHGRAFEPVLDAVPAQIGGARLQASLVRVWPGMDARVATGSLLAAAAQALGRPVVASERGGASDASHLASAIPLTVDGLGPLGGEAHAPGEHVIASSLRPRAEVALAVTAAALAIQPA